MPVTQGTVMNRRQIEDARKLEALEAQEAALLKKLGGSDDIGRATDQDMEALAGLEDDSAAALAAGDESGSGAEVDPDEEARAKAELEAKQESERKKAQDAEAAAKAKAAAEAKAKREEAKPKAPEPGTTEFWKREAETWRRRKGESDSHLTPVQQEAARLRQELDELKSKQNEDRFSDLRRELESLRSALAANGKPAQSEMPEDEAIQTELMALKTVNPEAARLVELESRRFNKNLEAMREETRKELEEVRKAKAELENRKVEIEQRDLRDRHRAFVLQHHPDVDDIYTYAIDALREWAADDSPEYLGIVQNPLSVSPQMFSKVIREFKNHAVETAGHEEGAGTREEVTPASGDLTTRVRKAATPTQQATQDDDLLSDDELNNFEALMQANWNKPERQEALLRRLEKTIASNPET